MMNKDDLENDYDEAWSREWDGESSWEDLTDEERKKATRARLILYLASAVMICVPIVAFWIFS